MATKVKFSVRRGYLALVGGKWVRITRTAYYQLRNPEISGKTELEPGDILGDDEDSTAGWLARHRGNKS